VASCDQLSAKAKSRPERCCEPRPGERHDLRAQDADSHAPGPIRTRGQFSEGVEHPRHKRRTASPQRHTPRKQPASHLRPPGNPGGIACRGSNPHKRPEIHHAPRDHTHEQHATRGHLDPGHICSRPHICIKDAKEAMKEVIKENGRRPIT